jgi:site-specific recombinase XerD
MEPALFNHCREILALEFKKKPEPEIGYLRIDEMKYLLSLPDTTNRHEFRDLAILSTLYETGARVQELIDLRYGDVSLNSCPTILLKGKGGKSRTVPIGKDVATILRNYIINYGVTETGQYIFTNSLGNKLTRVGVQYIIDKYVKRGRILDSSLFHGKITNHSFRHSKSMHLLEAGVNLIYIRDFLGHTSVTTTEIYARANVEIKRKTIEQHGATLATDDKYSRKLKDDLLSWLKTTL